MTGANIKGAYSQILALQSTELSAHLDLPLLLSINSNQVSGVTLNTARYRAGTKTSVTTVPTIIPPIIAIAIGPQNISRAMGISARLAAAAVSMIGLARLSEA